MEKQPTKQEMEKANILLNSLLANCIPIKAALDLITCKRCKRIAEYLALKLSIYK